MGLTKRLLRDWVKNAHITPTVPAPVHVPKPPIEVPTHVVFFKSSSKINYPKLEPVLNTYGGLSRLYLAPSKKAALAEYTDQEAADRLNAERIGMLTGDENLQIVDSLAIEDVTHVQPSKALRITQVHSCARKNPRLLVDVLRLFDVARVYQRTDRGLAYAFFDSQEGADVALAQMWSKEGVSLHNIRMHGNYIPTGHPGGPHWRVARA